MLRNVSLGDMTLTVLLRRDESIERRNGLIQPMNDCLRDARLRVLSALQL